MRGVKTYWIGYPNFIAKGTILLGLRKILSHKTVNNSI